MNKLNQTQINKIKQKILIHDGKFIVRINVAGDKNIPLLDLNANIYCIDDSFNIIWQIDPEPTKFNRDPFTYIEKNENGEIQASRFSGFQYKIDITTGKAEIIGWDK